MELNPMLFSCIGIRGARVDFVLSSLAFLCGALLEVGKILTEPARAILAL